MQIDPTYNLEEAFGFTLFDEAQKEALRKTQMINLLRLAFWISMPLAAILLAYTFLSSGLLIAMCAFVCTLFCISMAALLVKLISRDTGLTKAKLLSQAVDTTRATKILDELERKVFGKHDFAILATDGRYKLLPSELPRAENGLLFVLGKRANRCGHIYAGEPPSGELYVSKAKATKDSHSPKATLDFLSSKAAVSDLIAVIEEHHPLDPKMPRTKLSVTRTGWVNLLRLALNDWEKWEAMLLKGTTDREFEKSLIRAIKDRKKSHTEMSEILNTFVEGRNRNFRNWLVKLDFIDDVTFKLNPKYHNKTED